MPSSGGSSTRTTVLKGSVNGDPVCSFSTRLGYITMFPIIVEGTEPPEEVLVVFDKSSTLVYVRKGDRVEVEGGFKKATPSISTFRLRGRYFHAERVRNLTLGVEFW